jgi:hypothetical protein
MGGEHHDYEIKRKKVAPASQDHESAPLPELTVTRAMPMAGLAHPVQRKAVVGAAADPLEDEADRVAHSVVDALRRMAHSPTLDETADTATTAGRAEHSVVDTLRRMAHSPTLDETADGEATVHRHTDGVVGTAGGTLDQSLESRLNVASAGGTPLPDGVRGPLESALGADLGRVRIHTGPEAAALNRAISANAFTRGADIFFRDGMPDTSGTDGLHLLAHELTHTVQQGVSPTRQRGRAHAQRPTGGFAGAVGVRRSSGMPVIQRHAAYEHYLLGQLQPKELASIPEVRKIKDNAGQKKNVKKGHDKGLAEGTRTDEKMDDVKHLIDQEMNRLLTFRKNPEALKARAAEKGQVSRVNDPTNAEKDQTWNVPIVVLRCKGGDVVVSYSEMNTMPDLFGNPEAIQATPKKDVLALLQGVRQQLYIELSNLREELFGNANNALYSRILDGDFKDAQGPRSQAVNDKAYEIRTEKQVNKATTRKGEEHEQYFAALERNACHFAPESWAQWRGYHDKAIKLAQDVYDLRELAKSDIPTAETKKKIDKQADDLANQALIQNSFGEHYLQDSFAAGHLIDKTKIMQWFTIWLDENGMEMGHGPAAQGQWKMAVHAARQDLKSNPQALHDKMVRGEVSNGKEATDEIGMKSQTEVRLLMRWRALYKADRTYGTIRPRDLAKKLGMDPAAVDRRVKRLVKQGFVTKEIDIPGHYTIDFNQTQSAFSGVSGMGQAYEATRGTTPDHSGQLTSGQVDEAEDEFTLAAYNAMLSNAYIGSSTKFFHDKFCKEGLQVIGGDGTDLGRIYGDSNMLNAGGQKGVEEAAETSRQSRSAMFGILAGERRDEEFTTDQIALRFPARVKVTGYGALPIDQFNDRLHELGKQGLFKEAKTVGALIVYKAMNGISDKGALDVKKLVGPLDDGAF